MSRRYQLFGLTLDSDIALPEAPVSEAASAPDVTIGLAPIGPELGWEEGLRRLGEADDLYCVPGIARYRCSGGARIVVEPVPGVPERNLRLYLLGSVMGLLLHQRGLLPLHGNAIVIDGGAYVFVGRSGAGKSTLAAWFHDQGYPVLADDVAAIRFEGGQALVEAGLSRLRLWRDAVEGSGRTADDYPRSYAGDEEWDKFDVALPSRTLVPVPLAAVIVIGEDPSSVAIRPLTGLAAVDALMANVYRGGFLAKGKGMRRNVQACVQLAGAIPIFSWRRPKRRDAMDRQGSDLLEYLRGQA